MRFATITEKIPESYRACARQLRAARAQVGLSIKEAATRLDMSIIGYALVENGERRFETEAVYHDAMALLCEPRPRADDQ